MKRAQLLKIKAQVSSIWAKGKATILMIACLCYLTTTPPWWREKVMVYYYMGFLNWFDG